MRRRTVARNRGLWGLLIVVGLSAMIACGPQRGRQGESAQIPEGFDPAQRARELRDKLAQKPDNPRLQRDLGVLEWGHLGHREAALGLLESAAESGDATAQWLRVFMAELDGEPQTIWQGTRALVEGQVAAHEDRQAKGKRRRARRKLARTGADWQLDRLGDELTSAAVRVLGRVIERSPELREGFIGWYDGLDHARLAVQTRRALGQIRARLANRLGQDVAQYYADQGCLRDWRVSPMQGRFGVADLDEQHVPTIVDASADESASALTRLDCGLRLWNGREDLAPGHRTLVTSFEVASSHIALEITAGTAVIAQIDGRDLLREVGIENHLPQVRQQVVELSPGRHQLALSLPIHGRSALLRVRASELDGRPLTGHSNAAAVRSSDSSPISVQSRRACTVTRDALWRDPIFAPLVEMCRVADATHRRDLVAGGALTQGPGTATTTPALAAELAWIHSRFITIDSSLPESERQRRSSRWIDEILQSHPKAWLAWAQRLRRWTARKQYDQALDSVRADAAQGLATLDTALASFALHWQRGDEAAAMQALDAAHAHAPDDCGLWRARRQVAQAQDLVVALDSAVQALEHCSDGDVLAGRHAVARGQLDRAAEFFARRLERDPDDLDAMAALGNIELGRGRSSHARPWFEALLARAPEHADAYLALADAALAADQPTKAREWLDRGFAQRPEVLPLRQARARLGLPDELLAQRVSGQIHWSNFQRSGAAAGYAGEAAVYILDRDVAWIHENGTQRHLIHQMVHMKTRDALDHYGEVELPEIADVLTLRTHKPDGRVVDPEWIADKGGWSLRELEVGDVYEVEYIMPAPRPQPPAGQLDSGNFRFQSASAPFHLSELEVIYPSDMKLSSESRMGAPEPTRREADGRTHLLYRAQHIPRFVPEPFAGPESDLLPNVRVYSQLDAQDWLRGFALRIRGAQRSNAELEAKVAELVADAQQDASLTATTPEARRLETLWRWTLEHIEDGGGLERPVTHTFSERRGNRTMLLHTMLRIAGIRAELWILRARFAPELIPDGYPQLESFDSPMLAVWPDGAEQPWPVTTTSRIVPLGYLLPTHRQSAGLRVPIWPNDPAAGPVKAPSGREIADARHYQIQLQLDAGGRGSLTGRLELTGFEAIQWRNALESVEANRVRELFERIELPRLLPHAHLELGELELLYEERLDKALTFEFSARVSDAADMGAGELQLPAGIVSLNPGEQFTSGRNSRELDLYLPYGPSISFDVDIQVRGATLEQLPESIEVRTPYGSLVRYCERLGPAHIQLRSSSELVDGQIAAEDYPGLVDFVARVRSAELQTINFR